MVRRIATKARDALRARFDARVEHLIGAAIEARFVPALAETLTATDLRLERIEVALGSAHRAASTIAEEMDGVLAALTREVARLRAQVEEIRSRVEPDDGPNAWTTSQERARAG